MRSELKAWADDLSLFEPHLRGYLPGLAQPLHGLLSRATTRSGEEGEPEGWSGLTRRGALDRLVLSEFALAGGMPLEFARRAAERELLYWELSHHTPRQQGLLRVLFDAGPEMLGAPRLAQMALLLAWSRIARERKGKLEWCCAQDPLNTLAHELHAASLTRFLEARSPRPLTDRDISQWEAGARPLDENWIVTARPLESRCSRFVLVSTPDPARVRVQVGQQSVDLRLPEDARAVNLLRAPKTAPVNPTRTLQGEVRAPRFSDRGMKLMVQCDQTLSLLPIPNSPRQPQGNIRTYPLPFTGTVVGLGTIGKVWMIVMAQAAGTWMMSRLIQSDGRETRYEVWEAPAPVEGYEIGSLWEDRGALWIRRGSRLFYLPEWREAASQKTHWTEWGPVHAFLDHGVHSIAFTDEGRFVCLDQWPPRQVHQDEELRDAQEGQVWLGNSYAGTRGTAFFYAWEGEQGLCTLTDGKDSRWTFSRPAGRILGLVGQGIRWKEDSRQPGLLSSSGEELRLTSGLGETARLALPATLQAVAISPRYPWVCLLTTQGDLSVYCFYSHDFLFRARAA